MAVGKILKKCLVTAAILFATTTSYAYSNWEFEIAPYIWGLNMDGRAQTGTITSHVSESFSDILSQLDMGAMLWVSANKDKWGLFANALYADLSKDTPAGPFTVDSTEHFGLFTLGASYQVYEKRHNRTDVKVKPYAGLRYTLNNVTLKLNSLSVSNNQHWTDPIIGVRLDYTFNRNWIAFIAGDVGGTNLSSDKSYNLNGFVGYKPQSMRSVTFYGGYRYLYQKYVTGSGRNYFNWDMKLFGPVLGVGFTF